MLSQKGYELDVAPKWEECRYSVLQRVLAQEVTLPEFSPIALMEKLISQGRSLTQDELEGAQLLIDPIPDGTPVQNGFLSDEGKRLYALCILKWEHLESILGDTFDEGTAADNSHNRMESRASIRTLGVESSLLWELVESECRHRFPTELEEDQLYHIGPGYAVFLVPPLAARKNKSHTRGIDKNFVTLHRVPAASDLPN